MTPDKVEEIDLVGKYADKAMFLKSREIDEKNYPFIKKLTDEEYIAFRDVVRTTFTQHHQDLMSEVIKEIEKIQAVNPESNGRYNACEELKTIIKSK